MTATDTRTVYKVVRVKGGHGEPCHGGKAAFRWPLPTEDTPGDWVEQKGKLELCAVGLHLTREPADWWIDEPDVRLYEAEYDGEMLDGDSKICVRKARLLREVDWGVAQVWRDAYNPKWTEQEWARLVAENFETIREAA